jgi:hypothetical protein
MNVIHGYKFSKSKGVIEFLIRDPYPTKKGANVIMTYADIIDGNDTGFDRWRLDASIRRYN